MLVVKFGGTSVGTPQRMREVMQIVADGQRKIVVLSALSGTTNALVELTKCLYQADIAAFKKQLNQLGEHYQGFIRELFTDEKIRAQAHDLAKSHMQFIASFSKDMFTVHEERAILAQGELLSTAFFNLLCQQEGHAARLLPALDFMRINNDREPDLYFIRINLERLLADHPDIQYFITQGYICRNAFGEVDNLSRGGSDYTASLIGATVNAPEIQIWSDIDGMHNNDPRVVERTFPIEQLSFDEAAELAYFGAKVLHPSSIRPVQEKGIPVRLKNTWDPAATGTLISHDSVPQSVKAVAAKDGITAIKIKSGHMLMAYGFLRSVFEVFELYKTPIDMVTTSEVAVSLTIDDPAHLDAIVTDLKQFGHVEVDRDQTIVCVVGDFLADRSGIGARIFQSLENIPLRMVSYGGSKNNVSFLIHSADKQAALEALNNGLFHV